MSFDIEYGKRATLRDILCRYYFYREWDTESLAQTRFIHDNWNQIVVQEAKKNILISEVIFKKKYKLRFKLIRPPESIC